MTDYGIFIYTTHKNYSRCQKILETWGSKIPNIYFYTDRDYDDERFIKVNDDDAYESNVTKNLFAILDAEKKGHEWSLFIGDDNYLFKKNFEKYITSENSSENLIYGEQISGTWSKDKSLSYIDGASGILFNKTSLKNYVPKINENLESYRNLEFADVVIELIRKETTVNKKPTNENFENNKLYFCGTAPWDNPMHTHNRAITFHYLEEGLVKGWNFDKLYEYDLWENKGE